ncbi:MAG: XrtA-associated tyrosine autokinase [Xylophilus ampelinus]
MSSLIEQAAQRLEQLRQAGAAMPEDRQPEPVDVDRGQRPAGNPVPPPPRVEAAAVQETAVAQEPPASAQPVSSKRIELDLDALARAGIVSPTAPRSQIADQYRVIKRPLIANAMGRGAVKVANGNLIMVTSSLSGEGKTFTAINLAMSIATELNNTVMLVDADVARPSVLQRFGMSPAPGLLDVLLGEVDDLSGVLLRTNIDKFSILPSGTPHARSTELLASDAMAKLLDDMATRYPDRIIIFDSPPLLLTTEARVLASHMGQIVMVVQAEKTRQSDVQQALSTIESCPVKLLVLNQSKAGHKGGYGYGYGYGHGYEAQQA